MTENDPTDFDFEDAEFEDLENVTGFVLADDEDFEDLDEGEYDEDDGLTEIDSAA